MNVNKTATGPEGSAPCHRQPPADVRGAPAAVRARSREATHHEALLRPGACSVGIHVLLEEIGAPYEAVLFNLREGAQFKPEFTGVNPKSKVPTLERDDGSVLTEYPAIAFWLASRFRPRT